MAAAVLVWRREPVSGRLSQVELAEGSTVRDLIGAGLREAPRSDCYVTCNGRRASRDEALQHGLTYSVQPRLPGGKGGFGSMLRALGAQIEKTTNREACRDLSGRRLRDVNHEKEMAEWIKKQAEREAEKEQRRLERLKRKLAEPKHYFTDPEYNRQCSDMSERLEESVIKGLQATSSTVVSPESSDCRKRKIEPQSGKEKSSKKFLWSGVEGLEVSSDSDSDSDSESLGTSASCHSTEQRLHSDSESPGTSAFCDGAKQRLHSTDGDSDGPAPCPSSPATSKEPDQDPEPSGGEALSMELTDRDTPSNPGQTERLEVAEPEKPADIPEPRQESPSTDSSPFDLLTFSSAAELEALGLDKLKTELMSLGLKCGGTLQERAARLFSVRGLSREQIDPALFAKPAKGKKK
ncbi:splicing regulator SDE2 [Gastrophryne carolinensis]